MREQRHLAHRHAIVGIATTRICILALLAGCKATGGGNGRADPTATAGLADLATATPTVDLRVTTTATSTAAPRASATATSRPYPTATPRPTPTATPMPTTVYVYITTLYRGCIPACFSPSTVTITKGSTVVWTNQDTDNGHDVTGISPPGWGFGSLLNNGEWYSHAFNSTGTFKYDCSPHPMIMGTVVVT